MRNFTDIFDKKDYILKLLRKQDITEEDKAYVKKCLRKNTMILSIDQKFMLIKLLKDEEFTKECIENHSLGLSLDRQVDLVQEMTDKEYIKSYLEQKKSKLSDYYKMQLIKKTDDISYMKLCVQDDNFKLNSFYKMQLIKDINDSEFTKRCIKDNNLGLTTENKVALIKEIGDNEFTKKCVRDETLGLSIKEKTELIADTKDLEYILRCIKDDDLISNIEDKVELIKQTDNPEFIKSCIEDYSLGLSTEDKVKLIKCVRDMDYIKSCIEDKKLNLTEKDKLILILGTKDRDIIENGINKDVENMKKINLPQGMTVGVEIEAEGFGTMKQALFNGWRAKRDGSLEEGTEIISPVLVGSEKDSREIYNICNMLKTLGAYASERCGGHVHIGADYLTTYQSYANLVEMWGNVEEILYIISNKEGEITRFGAASKYAVPISEKVEEALEKGTINITNETELSNFVQQLQSVQSTRHSGINFMNVTNNYKKTVEFRIPNGTIEPETWIENINLFGGIISASEKLNIIQSKSEEMRTSQERYYLNVFEELKASDLSREEKLEILLELTIPEEEKEIYRNRYRVNSKILEQEETTLQEIRRNSKGKEPLDFKIQKEGEER